MIRDDILVQSVDPNGEQEDGYFPQKSLTIKAYYEEYTPAEFGNEAYVINKTYSVSEVESIGTAIETYTAIGGTKGYFTMTGRGVFLSNLLAYAGVDMDKVTMFNFSSVDSDKVISKAFIYDTTRYYYPEIDRGSYVGAKAVAPMIAVVSNQRSGGVTDPDYKMLEGTRFRLLFGATSTTSNSEFQRKWIHTIYVIYKGAPAAEIGDNEDDDKPGGGDNNEDGPGGNSDNGAGGGSGGDGGAGAGGDSDFGTGTGDGGNNPNGTGGNTGKGSAAGTGIKGTNKIDLGEASSISNQIPDIATPRSSGFGPSSKSTGSYILRSINNNYSVFRIMSKYSNENETPLDIKNPMKPIAGPVGAAMLVAGCIRMLFWYRNQRKMPHPTVPLIDGSI